MKEMKVGREKDSRGRLIWRVSYDVASRRIRKTFHSKEKANEWIAYNVEIAIEEGRIFWEAWHGISSIERHELMDALALMREGRMDHPCRASVQFSPTCKQLSCCWITF